MNLIERCPVVKKCVRDGLDEPNYGTYANYSLWCEGYQRSKDDDEPCAECKRCKYCILNEGEVQE